VNSVTTLFDHAMREASRLADDTHLARGSQAPTRCTTSCAAWSVPAGPGPAMTLVERHRMPSTMIPPQWQAILQVIVGEVLLTRAETWQAQTAFRSAIVIAGAHRLSHQIQRTVRGSARRLPALTELALPRR